MLELLFFWISACAYHSVLLTGRYLFYRFIDDDHRVSGEYFKIKLQSRTISACVCFRIVSKNIVSSSLENNKRMKTSGKLFHSNGICILVFYTWELKNGRNLCQNRRPKDDSTIHLSLQVLGI